jgi:NADPH2:quinone reductase
MVDVKATGNSSAQSLTVAEKYQHKPGLPFVPEIEISDVFPLISDGTDSVAVVDRFSAALEYGEFAENVAVRATHCQTA